MGRLPVALMVSLCIGTLATGCQERLAAPRARLIRGPVGVVPIDDVEVRTDTPSAGPPLPRGALRRWGFPRPRAGVVDHLFLPGRRLLLVQQIGTVQDYQLLRMIDLKSGQDLWVRRVAFLPSIDPVRRRLASLVKDECRLIDLDTQAEKVLPALYQRDPCLSTDHDGRWLEQLDRFWVHQTKDASEVLKVTDLLTGSPERRIRPADSLSLKEPLDYRWTFLAGGQGLWIWDTSSSGSSGVLVDLRTGLQRSVDAGIRIPSRHLELELPVVQDATALGLVVVLGSDSKLRGYDRRTFKPALIAGRTEIPGPAWVLMGGARLLVADAQGFKVLEGRTGSLILAVPRTRTVVGIGFSETERRMWISDSSAPLQVFDLETGRRIATPGSLAPTRVQSSSRVGRWLDVGPWKDGAGTGGIGILDLRTGIVREIPPLPSSAGEEAGGFERALLSADGQEVVVERDWELIRLDARTWRPLSPLPGGDTAMRLLPGSLDPTGRYLALSRPDGLEVRSVVGNQRLALLPGTLSPLWVAWGTDQRSLLVCVEHVAESPRDELVIFNGPDPRRFTARSLKLMRYCGKLRPHSSGRYLLHEVEERDFCGFEILTLPELQVAGRVAVTEFNPGEEARPLQAVLSPDGKRMATLMTVNGGTLRVDLVSVNRPTDRRMVLRTPGSYQYAPFSLRASDNGTRVMLTLAPSTTEASTGETRTWLWDFATGRLVHHVTWPTGYWRATTRGPGDTLWAVIDTHPGTAPFHREIWQGPPLRRLGSFEAPSFELGPVLFSPRRKYLFTDQRDGSVLLWRVP